MIVVQAGEYCIIHYECTVTQMHILVNVVNFVEAVVWIFNYLQISM